MKIFLILLTTLLGMNFLAQAAEEPDPIEQIVLEAQGIKPTESAEATKGVKTFPMRNSSKIEHSSKPISPAANSPVEEKPAEKPVEASADKWADPEADQVIPKSSTTNSVADFDPTNGLATLCNEGNIEACMQLSRNYLYGMDIGQDLSKAIEYADKACQLGSGEGCARVGFYLRRGLGTQMNLEEAKNYLAKACELGNSAGCNDLAEMYFSGIGTEQSKEQAQKYYEMACRQQNVAACRSLESNFGISQKDLEGIQQPTPTAEKKLAIEIPVVIVASELAGNSTTSNEGISLVQVCDMGSGEACSQLSNAFLTGKGYDQSDEKAFLLAKKSCDLNYPLGCYQTGHMYREGIGTAKSGSQMKKFYEKGCNLGAREICAALGYEYYLGEKIRLSYEEAKKYYGEACDMDDEEACKAYADIVKQGK